MRRSPFAGLAFALLATSPALAEPPGSQPLADPSRASNEVRIDFGLASPVGEMGLSYQRALLRWLVVEPGVGVGATGVQLSLMAKVVLWGSGGHGFVSLGGGASLSQSSDPTQGRNHWGNGEVAAGYRFDGGGTLSIGVGGTVFEGGTLLGTPIAFAAADSKLKPGDGMPFVRVGVGGWF